MIIQYITQRQENSSLHLWDFYGIVSRVIKNEKSSKSPISAPLFLLWTGGGGHIPSMTIRYREEDVLVLLAPTASALRVRAVHVHALSNTAHYEGHEYLNSCAFIIFSFLC